MKYVAYVFPDSETEVIKAVKAIVADKTSIDAFVGRKRLTPQQQQKDTQVIVYCSPGTEEYSGTRKRDLITLNVYAKEYSVGSTLVRLLAAELQNFYSNRIEQIIISTNPQRVAYTGEEEFFTVKFFVWMLPEA